MEWEQEKEARLCIEGEEGEKGVIKAAVIDEGKRREGVVGKWAVNRVGTRVKIQMGKTVWTGESGEWELGKYRK